MVAIKNLTITSALLVSVADQAFAAPIISSTSLEARAPADDLTVRVIDEIDERDIDERSPKGRMGLAHHVVNAATQVGTAWAKNRRPRDVEELTERDISELYERGFALDERDIDERSPKGRMGLAHHVVNAATQVGTAWAKNRRPRDVEELEERDIDERSPKGRMGLAHHVVNAATQVGTAWAKNRRPRDVEELEERDMEELDERDIDERSPKGRMGLAHHVVNAATQVGTAWAKNRGRRDMEELDERDIDERSPKGRMGLAHHVVNAATQVGTAWAKNRGRRDLEELEERDLDTEDLVARALSELDERDLEYIYARYLEDVEATEN